MATDKRKIQEINAGSMADIAFLLLIFFLVATTMNTDTGLVRMLPPMPPEDQPQDEIKVKERNLFLVLISGSGNIMAGPSGKQEIIDLRQLKDKTKEFISTRWTTRTSRRKPKRKSSWPTAASGYIPKARALFRYRPPVIRAISPTSWCRTSSHAPSTRYVTRSP